jgi:hypothetical protein
MKFKPETFNKVEPNSIDRIENCAPPEFLVGERGIRITAPKEVFIDLSEKRKYIVICGEYSLALAKLEEFANPMLIHVYHVETKKSFKGYLQEINSEPSPSKPPDDSIVIEDTDVTVAKIAAYGSSFNPDILSYVDFPLLPGNYIVYVEYGGEKSNEVLIHVKMK